jgi:hypothetical protein
LTVTTLPDIVDLFMSLQQDYRLVSLYSTSGSAAFGTYVEPWLLFSVTDFAPVANQSLNYSTTTQSFDVELNIENQLILARIMTRYWMQKLVDDVAAMKNFVVDHDFSRHSEAANFKEKKDALNLKKEEISQMLNDYSYRNNGWKNWYNQMFDTG